MTNKELAQKLLDLLGGKDNVLANAACMTRLRVTVKDTGNVDTEGIKALDGVMGLVEDDTMQIVLGPGKVNKVLEEFSKLTGLAKGVADESVVDAAATNKAAQKAKYESKPVQAFLKKISNVFVALLPGIIAAGLINGICNVINVSTAGALAGEWWYQGIRSMGWALFAYLPILVGYNAAREFGGSAALGGIAGMMCIANSAMPLLAPGAADPATAILLPLTNAQYNPAAGGMIAALIAGAFFAWMERQIRKVMPNALDTFLSPLLVLIIGAFALMLVIQPVGAWLTTAIFSVLTFIFEKLGVLGGYILSAGFLPLVSVGLHQALTPIHAMLNDPDGATKGINYLLPILMMAGGGQVGAGLALYFKTKNAKLKEVCRRVHPRWHPGRGRASDVCRYAAARSSVCDGLPGCRIWRRARGAASHRHGFSGRFRSVWPADRRSWPAAWLRCRYAACLCRRLCPDVVLWRRRAEDQRVFWRVV